jgi:lipopolysaccharide biosynthesis glycosyltransferase
LPVLLPNIYRIIYIDGDSIILKDLMELYTLNFGQKFILGKLDIYPDDLDKFKIYIKNYINCGILLMDLYSLRKFKYVDKFLDYIKNHNDSIYLRCHDQTLINYICHDKIGILKPKYYMWPFKDYLAFINEHKRTRIQYDPIDVQEGFNAVPHREPQWHYL